MNQKDDCTKKRPKPDGCQLCHFGWLYLYDMSEPYTTDKAARSITRSLPCSCPDGLAIQDLVYGSSPKFGNKKDIARRQALVMNAEATQVGEEMKRRWIATGKIPLLEMVIELAEKNGGWLGMKRVTNEIATPANRAEVRREKRARGVVEEFVPGVPSEECPF